MIFGHCELLCFPPTCPFVVSAETQPRVIIAVGFLFCNLAPGQLSPHLCRVTQPLFFLPATTLEFTVSWTISALTLVKTIFVFLHMWCLLRLCESDCIPFKKCCACLDKISKEQCCDAGWQSMRKCHVECFARGSCTWHGQLNIISFVTVTSGHHLIKRIL